MCTVLLPPGGYPTAVNKYITLFVYTVHNQKAELHKVTDVNTGLFELIVGVLTTCHTQYT